MIGDVDSDEEGLNTNPLYDDNWESDIKDQ